MTSVRELWEMDRARPKNILVIGDAMEDLWFLGKQSPCQDGCMKFVSRRMAMTPGGAANAARSLFRWASKARLISPWRVKVLILDGQDAMTSVEAFGQVDHELCHEEGVSFLPRKSRYLDDGKVVYRDDIEDDQYGLDDERLTQYRQLTILAVERLAVDAVLISDYAKGFLDGVTMRKIAAACHRRDVPVVADCKQAPGAYAGAILKYNSDYLARYAGALLHKCRVVTHGKHPPLGFVGGDMEAPIDQHRLPDVPCVNHVGAGDCFAAVLTLALAHGFSLADAAAVAHHAGRVYVQYPFSRPPWPFEVVKDAEPVAGKVLDGRHAGDLRRSLEGRRMVFANGVFRIPHAGHADMLAQARAHGDVLVVGVNDDVSAFRQRGAAYVMPLEQRTTMLASMAAVDWVIPFGEDDPRLLMEQLRPDVLVKGEEYRGAIIPGSHSVKEVILVPERVRVHASSLAAAIREG